MSLGVKGGTSYSFTNDNRMIANNSYPIIGPDTPDGQVIYMAWRLQPFNFTRPTANAVQEGEIQFGLRNCLSSVSPPAGGCNNNMIAYKVVQHVGGDKSFFTLQQAFPSSIWTTITNPNPNAKFCFNSTVDIYTPSTPCNSNGGGNVTNAAIQYGQSGGFNLERVHVFSILMKLLPVSKKSWIAFSVDSMAYQNITQTACQCIDGSGSYTKMYPFIGITDFNTLISPPINACTTCPSLATFIDYVGVWDYLPPALPTGQLVNGITAINPSGFNSNGFNGSPSFDNVFRNAAFDLGGGQPAFGGVLVTAIVFAFLIMATSMAWRGIPPGFIMDVEGIGVVVMMTALGILPIWITVSSFILIGAVTFKVLPGDIKT